MANSLNFLNKPASTSTARPIGPQPKPSTAAPKSAFLDKSNPWAVGGGSAPAPKAVTPKTPAPKAQTPAKTQQSAAIPSRGYNYTDASYTGATPQQRAREVDQAQMAAQATRQRKAQAPAPAPQPAPIQVVQPRPAGNQVPLGYVQPGAYMPPIAAAANLAQRAAAPAMRALNSWMAATMGSARPEGNPYLRQQQGDDYRLQPAVAPGTPNAYVRQQQGDDYRATPAPAQEITNPYILQQRGLPPFANSWQMAPTAEQAMAMRAAQPAPNQAYLPMVSIAPPAPIVPTNAYLLDGIQPAAQQPILTAPTPEGARAAANAAQTIAPTSTPTATIGQRPGSYGWQPPGPITVERQATAQRGQRPPYFGYAPPLYTDIGRRAMMTEEQLAAEDAYRQRDAAGGMLALRQAGTFRPWSSYSDAEKYYRRYGVMPQGPQAAPDTSGAAALAANEAQNARLYDDYWDRYRAVTRGRRWYGGTRPGQQETMYGTEMANALQGIGQPARQGTAQAAAPTTQESINNALLVRVNPQAAQGKATAEDVNQVAREIIKRYAPGLNPDILSLTDIAIMMRDAYTPPPGMEQQYGDDLKWLAARIPSE